MMQEFAKCGYRIVEFDEEADIYVVNTCTVTNMADKKSRQMLRKVKEMNSKSILVAVRMLCTSCRAGVRKNTGNRFDFRNKREERYCYIY